MKISDLVEILDLKVISGEGGIQNEIKGAYASDLLSDVVGNADAMQVWVTLQTHVNVVAIASLKDLSGIILVNNNMPDQKSIDKSNEEKIPLLQTSLTAFEIIGKLYKVLEDNASL